MLKPLRPSYFCINNVISMQKYQEEQRIPYQAIPGTNENKCETLRTE